MGIDIEVVDMESNGCFIPRLKKIFINQKLSEEEMKLVIYHELKHALDHSDFYELYNLPKFRSKMESEAQIYVIDTIIEENNGEYNYSQLIKEFGIGMGYDARFAQ